MSYKIIFSNVGYDISTILLKRLRVIGMDVYAWEKKGQLDHVVGELIQWTKEVYLYYEI